MDPLATELQSKSKKRQRQRGIGFRLSALRQYLYHGATETFVSVVDIERFPTDSDKLYQYEALALPAFRLHSRWSQVEQAVEYCSELM